MQLLTGEGKPYEKVAQYVLYMGDPFARFGESDEHVVDVLVETLHSFFRLLILGVKLHIKLLGDILVMSIRSHGKRDHHRSWPRHG